MKTKRLVQVFAKLSLITTEAESGYYHHRWSVLFAPLFFFFLILGNLDILGKSRKCFELKGSAQPATRNENFDN